MFEILFGLIVVLLMLVALPFQLVRRYRMWIRGFEYRPMQLMRASHGLAGIALAVFGWHLSRTLNINQPVGLPLAVPIVWGLVVFLDAAKRSRGEFDGYLIFRSCIKAVVGVLALLFVPASMTQIIGAVVLAATALASTGDYKTLGTWLAYAALWIIGIWCMTTGITKFLLLLRGWKRKKAPPVSKNQHGASDVATGEQAARAMKGEGRRSKMDGVKF